MDSGCTFHITPDRDVLFDFKEIDGGKVLMGNNTFSEVKGMGKLKIIKSEGTTVILSEVRYMPTMSRNLISYGQLEKNGCKYEGETSQLLSTTMARRLFLGNIKMVCIICKDQW